MSKRQLVLTAVMICAGCMASGALHAAIVYDVNFDQGAQTPAPSPYTAGVGEVLPDGVSGVVGAGAATNLVDPAVAGPQGGQALSQMLGGAWPNLQGYLFTGGPTIANNYTIEFLINPHYTPSGVNFGPATISTLFGSEHNELGGQQGFLRIAINQSTGQLYFSPRADGGFGEIYSSPLSQGEWHHVAAVVRGTGVQATQETELWVDGVLQGTGVYPLTWETSAQYQIYGDFGIGRPVGLSAESGLVGRNFEGLMDAFAVSDTALDPSQFVLRPVVVDLVGDVNHDGIVDVSDIQTVAANWLLTGPTGDANHDGLVDISDIQVIAAHWLETGGGGAGVSAVPEPSGVVLSSLAAAALALFGRARRRLR